MMTMFAHVGQAISCHRAQPCRQGGYRGGVVVTPYTTHKRNHCQPNILCRTLVYFQGPSRLILHLTIPIFHPTMPLNGEMMRWAVQETPQVGVASHTKMTSVLAHGLCLGQILVRALQCTLTWCATCVDIHSCVCRVLSLSLSLFTHLSCMALGARLAMMMVMM